MTLALRSDPAVVRSLLEGEGIIDVRPPGEVPKRGTVCWLDPSGAAAELKPAYGALAELSPAGNDRVAGWAEVAGSAVVRLDDALLEGLNGKTVRALSPLAGTEVAVVALRVHRLAEALPAGELPADPTHLDSEPALSDGAFAAKLAGVAESVPGFSS